MAQCIIRGRSHFTDYVIGLGGGGFQIMTADDGGGFFCNHFRANFGQFYYSILIKVNQNFKNI